MFFKIWCVERDLVAVCVCVSVSGERVLTFGCLVCVCVKRDTVAICVRCREKFGVWREYYRVLIFKHSESVTTNYNSKQQIAHTKW